MTTKILVTGGAGYIGSILVPLLLERGYEVTVIDNFMYKQASLNNICQNSNFKIFSGDIRLKSDIKPLLDKNDILIPLAAYVGAPLCDKDPVGARTTNHDSIALMLKNISNNQLLLMPTTNSAYGSGDIDNFCTEESELNPISKYARDKVEVEKMIMERENSVSFRLATVFGMSPRMRIDLLVNDFTYRAFHDGFIILFESHFKRNFIHVRDVAKAFLHGIDNFSSMKNNIFNIGLSDANISKLELCERIQKYIKKFIYKTTEIGKDPDQRNYIVSNEKIEKTGFSPDYSLDEGIKELIKGFTMINRNSHGNI